MLTPAMESKLKMKNKGSNSKQAQGNMDGFNPRKYCKNSNKTTDSVSFNERDVSKKSSSQTHRSSVNLLKEHRRQTDASDHRGGRRATIITEKAASVQKTRLANPVKKKQNVKREVENQAQLKKPREVSLSSLKHVEAQVFPEPTTASSYEAVKGSETVDKRHKKRHSRKSEDGMSNWMRLCATLSIDATARKSEPVKRPATESNVHTGSSQPKRAKPDVWFENVDKILIEPAHADEAADGTGGGGGPGGFKNAEHNASDKLIRPDSFKGITNCVAMDCEMVGVGPHGEESILARVSVVNHFGVCLYDKFVLPREEVVDYRTFVSGVTPENLATGEEFSKVQAEVSDIIRGRILVGHALHNDLRVLYLTHPHKMIRDTSQYKPFRELFKGRIPSLKKLTDRVLGVRVQEGQHSSVQDAQAAMRLYTMYRQKWEKELRKESKLNRKRKKKK